MQIFCNIHKTFGQDSCDRCEEEDARSTRYAVIKVTVPVSWLTDEGRCDAEDGWKEIEKNIKSSLSLNHRSSVFDVVQLDFDDWEYE